MKMWLQYFLVSIGAIAVAAIKIPLQPLESTQLNTEIQPNHEQIQSLPIYYETAESNGGQNLEVIRDVLPTPATYLLPPSPDKQNEYFVKPTEPGEQTEWYPIPTPAKQQEIIEEKVQIDENEDRPNLRTGRILNRGQVITVPSRNLLPPRENAQHDFVIMSLSPDLELPSEEIDHTLNQHANIELPVLRPPLEKPYPVNFRVKPDLVPFITPPNVQAYKNPTRLYPKKYVNEFKPIPIPVTQYKEESEEHTVKPQSHDTVIHHVDYLTPTKEKKNYLYEETQKKRKNRNENAKPETIKGEEVRPAEQDTSESIHRYPGNLVHHHSRKESIKHKPANKPKGERTEFRMHGMKGPNSYQFGYDTGKGKNRQFRYEERDNDGHVRGHYGYVDKFGKLRVVNYDADPQLGFRAEAPVVKD